MPAARPSRVLPRTRAVLAAVAVLAGLVTTAGASAATEPGPRLLTPAAVLNDAISCPARLRHKVVLLVHGTSVTADENWSWNYVKALPHEGFDVCTVQMPDRLLIDIQVTTEYVVNAIRVIARRSGAPIDVVGLSQGALQPRWALRWWPDLRNLVDDYVSMAGTNRGSVFADASCVTDCIPSLWQQRTSGSLFLGALDRDDETPGAVSYTSVYSKTDEIIQPAVPDPVAAIRGASNIAVQDVCPGRYVGHVQSASDAAYFAVVLDALKHFGPADPSRIDRNYCMQTVMPYVDPKDAVVRTAEVYVFAGVVQAEHEKVSSEPPLRPYVRGKA